MDTRTRTIVLWSGVAVLVVAGIIMLVLSLGGSDQTPEQELNAIQTNAAETIAVQVVTLQAGLTTPTLNPSLTTPTTTVASLPAPTLQLQTPVLLPSTTATVGGCDNAVFITDVTIPDGTAIAPGQAFTKTWRVSNTGTCAWTATYQVIFLYGDSMSGKATAIGKAVKPGETVDVSVALIGPAAGTGNITGTWRLSNDKAQPFGTLLTVVVKTGAAATVTPVTATSTFTPTPTVVGYP
jgi:hypothetical protein